MIAYRAMVDVPKELVAYVAGLLRAERRRLGTRRRARKLSCAKQALMVLVWFRKHEDITLLAAGFGVSRATGYRYALVLTQFEHKHLPQPHVLSAARARYSFDTRIRAVDRGSW